MTEIKYTRKVTFYFIEWSDRFKTSEVLKTSEVWATLEGFTNIQLILHWYLLSHNQVKNELKIG